MKLTKTEKEWLKTFNIVMKGVFVDLHTILPDHVDRKAFEKKINDSRSSLRRDSMNNGTWVNGLGQDDEGFTVQDSKTGLVDVASKAINYSLNFDKEWSTARGTYHSKDYQSAQTSPEDAILDYIDYTRKAG